MKGAARFSRANLKRHVDKRAHCDSTVCGWNKTQGFDYVNQIRSLTGRKVTILIGNGFNDTKTIHCNLKNAV